MPRQEAEPTSNLPVQSQRNSKPAANTFPGCACGALPLNFVLCHPTWSQKPPACKCTLKQPDSNWQGYVCLPMQAEQQIVHLPADRRAVGIEEQRSDETHHELIADAGEELLNEDRAHFTSTAFTLWRCTWYKHTSTDELKISTTATTEYYPAASLWWKL